MRKPVNAQREIELKFSISKNRVTEVAQFLSSLNKKDILQIRAIHEIEQKDSYFDNEVFDLAQHHCSLRVRETDAQRVLAFKRAPVGTRTALTDRVQVEGKYGKRSLARITRNAPWLLLLNDVTIQSTTSKDRFKELYDLGLRRVLNLENKRTVYIAEYAGQLQLELCFDRVQTTARTATHTFFELEGEYVSGDIDKMKDLEEYLRLQFPWLRSSKISKYERSLRSLKIWKHNRQLQMSRSPNGVND